MSLGSAMKATPTTQPAQRDQPRENAHAGCLPERGARLRVDRPQPGGLGHALDRRPPARRCASPRRSARGPRSRGRAPRAAGAAGARRSPRPARSTSAGPGPTRSSSPSRRRRSRARRGSPRCRARPGSRRPRGWSGRWRPRTPARSRCRAALSAVIWPSSAAGIEQVAGRLEHLASGPASSAPGKPRRKRCSRDPGEHVLELEAVLVAHAAGHVRQARRSAPRGRRARCATTAPTLPSPWTATRLPSTVSPRPLSTSRCRRPRRGRWPRRAPRCRRAPAACRSRSPGPGGPPAASRCP